MPSSDIGNGDPEIARDNVRRGTSVAASSREDVTLYEYTESRLVAQRIFFEAKMADLILLLETRINEQAKYFEAKSHEQRNYIDTKADITHIGLNEKIHTLDESTNKLVQAEDLRLMTIIEDRIGALTHLFNSITARLDERFITMLETHKENYHVQRMATEAAFTAAQVAIEKANTSAQLAIKRTEEVTDKRFDTAANSQREYFDRALINVTQIFASFKELESAYKVSVDLRFATLSNTTVDLSNKNREIVQIRFDDAQEAIRKADLATEKRFESVNEFRGQLSDQVARFASREGMESLSKESKVAVGGLAEAMNLNNKNLTEQINAEAKRATESISQIGSRISNLEGRIIAYSGAIGVIVAVISIVFSFLIHFLH